MRQWKARYRDEKHDEQIILFNEEADKYDNLSFTIDGITFLGGDLSDFVLKDPAQYEAAAERFHLLKWGGHMTAINHTMPYVYNLQRYSLDMQIPVALIRTEDGSEAEGRLHIGFRFVPHDMQKSSIHHTYCDDQQIWWDDQEVTDFRFTVDGEEFPVHCDSLWMEKALTELIRLLRPKYELRCCFCCQWSDYSPYGSDDFGTMLCYRANKEAYLKVNDKSGYFEHLEGLPCEQRQETFLCHDFAPRKRCGGYRGFVKGE